MAKLIDQYAAYLLVNAVKENKLDEIYHYSVEITEKGQTPGRDSQPALFDAFSKIVPDADIRPILIKFQAMARKRLGLMDVSVISATPLSDAQHMAIHKKLTDMYGSKFSLVTKVDASLLGGLCIIVGHQVIDNSIKKRLADMKKNVYKGVYFKNAN